MNMDINQKISTLRQSRLPYIDIAKGIGILLVVLGHVQTYASVHDMVYLFHMPLFFLLSGMVFKKDESWWVCMKKKLVHLLLPYLFFMVLFVPLRIITDYLCTGEVPVLRLSMLGLSYFDAPLWFVIALFGVIVIMRSSLSFIRNRYIIACLIIALSITGYLLMLNKIHLAYISRALYLLPFFALGMIIKKWQNTKLLFIAGILLFGFGIVGLGQGHLVPDTLQMQIDSNPLFVYLPAIGGSMLVLAVSLAGSKVMLRNVNGGGNWLSRCFSYLGRNSFYIFAAHFPFILFMNSLCFGSLTEPYFSPLYACILMLSSILFSLGVGWLLKHLAPSIFR